MSHMLATTVSIPLLASADHASHAEHLGGSHLSGWMLAALGLATLAVVVAVFFARSREAVVSAVALCSAGAGAAHAVATPEHFQEHLAFGVFFLAVTVWQLGVFAATRHRPSRALWASTLAGTVAVLAVWAVSRTTGLPFGPEAWTSEPAGYLDLASGAYELAIVAGCLQLLRDKPVVVSVRRSRPVTFTGRRGALANP
jgi:hypothetical protein